MIDFNYNSAYLTFKYDNQSGMAISNVINNKPNSPLTINKESISKNYYLGDNASFIITITNHTDNPINDVSIKENLGTYFLNDNSKFFTPLSYQEGSLKYYINGISQSPPKVTVNSQHIIFDIEIIPSSSVITLVYNTTVNSKAPLDNGSMIINTSNLTAETLDKSVESSCTITVRKNADIKIIKQVSENKISKNVITYDFTICNYGNTEATNVTLKDTINPKHSNMKVFVDSQCLKFSDYNYISGNVCIPSYGSKRVLNVPPATFLQDKNSGIFTINPGTIKISVEIEVS